jgi:hypothetical protein
VEVASIIVERCTYRRVGGGSGGGGGDDDDDRLVDTDRFLCV